MLSNTIVTLSLKILGALSGIILTYFITTNSTEKDAGVFFQFLMLISFCGTIATMGAPILILRNVSKYSKASKWDLINNDISFLTIQIPLITLFASAFISVGIYNLLSVKYDNIYCLIIGVISFALIQCYAASFQAMGKFRESVCIQNIITPLTFLISLAVINYLYQFNSLSYIEIYTVCLVFVIGITLQLWHKNKNTELLFSPLFREENKKSLINVFIATLMIQIVQWSSQLAISGIMTHEDLAVFSAAQRVSILASFIMIAVNIIVIPKLSVAHNQGEHKELNALVKKASLLNLAFGLPIILVLLFFSVEIMNIFGNSYQSAAPFLIIMSLGQFVNLATGPVADLLNMTNNDRDVRNILIFTGLLSISLSFILTNLYGLHGAAYAAGITVAAQNLAASYFAYKRCGFNPLLIFRRI